MHIGHSADNQRILEGKRVLVVEDEALVGMLIENGLVGAGAEVVGPAYSVKQALGLIAKEAADGGLSAAVLDINLHGEMVLPVADRLAALGVPFIFATGYAEGYNRGLHMTAPSLTKPFDGETVASVVGVLTATR